MITITKENYYSREVDLEYYSYSQVKSFMQCSYQAMAYLNGKFKYPTNDNMRFGSLLHSYFDGKEAHEAYIESEKENLCGKNGKLYAKFDIQPQIDTLEKDEYAMKYMTGEHEVILTAMFDDKYPFKACIDVVGDDFLTDLKTCREITPTFIDDWGYRGQLALYKHLYNLSNPKNKKDNIYIVAVSKQDIPDHEVFSLVNYINEEVERIKEQMPYIDAIKKGLEEPVMCGKCWYCRTQKKCLFPKEI